MSKPILLYAEDDLESRENYALFLQECFSQILLASNGEEALALYKSHAPDILLLDISMPLLNGLDVVEHVRKENAQIPIVMLTAHSDREKLLKAVSLKLDAYLLKPVDDRELLKTMQTLIRQVGANSKVTILNELTWDRESRKLYCYDNEIKLTRKERLLMHLLCEKPGSYFTHDELIIHIWDDDIPDHTYNKKLIQLIYRLNKKIAQILPKQPHVIENSYTLGYKVNTLVV